MEFYKRDFFISRIQAGYIPLQMDNLRFIVNHPSVDIALQANEEYLKAYDRAQNENLMTGDDLLLFLIKQGLWSEKMEDEYQRIVPGHIEYWKVELYKSVLKSKTKETIRKYLDVAKKEYNRLHDIRHHYDYITIDGYSNYIKNLFLISQCTLLNGQPVDWDEQNLSIIMGLYYHNLLKSEEVRILARTTPWTNLWPTLKISGSIFQNSSITIEQQSLLSWSIMYDRINESPDCPSDNVIEDDDVLDGWLLLQKQKRDAERKQEEIEGAISKKLQNADELYVPVETLEDAQKLETLNPVQIQNVKRQRMAQLRSKGRVLEQEFKDVQLKRSMQMQQAYNQLVKGKGNG